MAVPHTRPLSVTAHATDPTLIAGNEAWMRRGAGAGQRVGDLLEFRLGECGHRRAGYAVARAALPGPDRLPAAAELLLRVGFGPTGLALPTGDLRGAAERTRADIDQQVADAEEVGRVVAALEQQYDAFLEGRTRGNLLAERDGPAAHAPTSSAPSSSVPGRADRRRTHATALA